MESSIFHRLSSVLWGLIVTLIVLLAVYVSAGRLLTSNLSVFQAQILEELNRRVPFTIQATRVGGEWHSFTPIIVLDELHLSVDGSSEPPLELSGGRIAVDVLDSLRTRSLQLTRLVLDEMSLRGELTADGRLRIRGFEGGGRVGQWYREFLLNVELVELRDNRLLLTLPSGEKRNMEFSLRLTRDGSHRRVEVDLVSNRGTRISALAEGVGDPFTPELFSGDIYLDIESGDLGAVKDMLANGPPGAWSEGALKLELWFSWDRGKPVLEARAEAHDLLVADEKQTWRIPLDRLALEARLIERKNRWTLFASNLELEKDGVVARLHRLQLDAWGKALRVRATDIPLQPVNAIASGLEALPEKLADVLRTLQPDGMFPALQLSVGDIASPGEDWAVEANFDGVSVESWKGAPGITSASGYLEIDQSGGFVVLDSQQMAMDFPTIYREPLGYDDFHGTINIDWDAQALRLSSGMITAVADEGTVRVLFGLNVPLVRSAVGMEMDLLVGLQNSHPIARVKYVPYVLNESLLNWLNDSIGDGVVEQGAFLWRGSLKRAAAPMRTVQLAFNISETGLNYHPSWPPVTVSEGTILIDDSSVSVWSNRARLFDSEVEHLSAEVWMNPARQLLLAVDGSVKGPADDGLAVLNESPLTDIVGGTFTHWAVQGELETDLYLQMNLTDTSVPPEVAVATRLRGVDLDIRPGNLPVRAASGNFNYSSAEGFSSADLAGELWGKPLSARVGQREARRGGGRSGAGSAVEVNIATRVEMADLREWLDLESLAFARGETAVDIQLLVAPGDSPLLRVDSELAGVSLDLPSPWRKDAADKSELSLAMPLGAGSNRLDLDLDGQLKLHLQLEDGALRGGAMAVQADPALAEPGVLLLSGHAPLVQADEWTRFITEYFYTAGAAQTVAEQSALEPAGAGPGEDTPDTELAIKIDQLRADQLVIWDRELRDVVFSLAIERGQWHLSARTDWLRGEFLRPADNGVYRLELEYLDLAGMEQLDPQAQAEQGEQEQVEQEQGEQETRDIPDMDVAIENLSQGDLTLGQLSFELRNEGAALSADKITGELAGMQLRSPGPGKLVWQQGEDSQTRLQARLHFSDLGDSLAHFGYERIVETEKGQFDIDLSWPGAPQDFALAEGRGSVLVDIGEGRFLEAPSGASGALKVVNILNLADIVRRLSLSQMFESGIPFYTVKGEIFLHTGVIEVPRLDVQGSSGFQFSGVSDIAQRTMEGELVATLPVANNLPWVAALTASLPVAAGVYVMSKLLQKQVNRLSSAVYSISGSWDNPEVKFEHIFDVASQRPQSAIPAQAPDKQEAARSPAVNGELPPAALDPQSPAQSAPP